jgi:peptidoglycan/xylan/chitin deacetylase (PgdA/CDA1 family)
MKSVSSRLARRGGIVLGFLVVIILGGACAMQIGAEAPGQVAVVSSAAPTPDAAATITANLAAALASPAPAALQNSLPLTPTGAADVPQLLLPTATPLPPAPLPPTVTAVPTATPTLPLEPTPDGVARTAKVPILMYHYISSPPAGADKYRIDLSTPPELFAAQLDRLRAEGYTTISLYQVMDYLTRGVSLPPKPVVLTFDDGYRDNYEHAFPLLRERGMTGTFFVVTDFIDEQRPDYLAWDMAREMLAGGMSIESHGRNHFTLEGQSDDYLVWQALGSLETIQYELGVRPRFVSYPAGDYDQRTIEIFRSANYWAGLTTEQGTVQSSERPFEFERIRMRNTTTPDDMLRYMQADW